MIDQQFDIVIVGGGPVGMALALALREHKLSILLLEARELPEEVDDPRPLALSYGSRLILQHLGIWKNLTQPTPITTIHISNFGHFGHTVLTPDDAGVPALGYVINYHNLYHTMGRSVRDYGVVYRTNALVTTIQTGQQQARITYRQNETEKQVQAKLLVLADGGKLAEQIDGIRYRVHDYRHTAIVANIKTESSRPGTAFERFTLNGPLALLPSGDKYALVWTMPTAEAKKILRLDDRLFLLHLHEQFGDRLGNFIHAGKRSSFPLILKHASTIIGHRSVIIGNAAQTLHPVAGQGFNLGLRDAWELASEISHIPSGAPGEPGSSRMLSVYSKRRQRDKHMGRVFTDSLIKLFTADLPLIQTCNGIGLTVLDCLPPAKRLVARQMIFGTKN
ncbi:2-octaprenyl-6-methoxyphenol hydroxylase [Nitrosomonas eutropha]|uniref:FAD-dependent monooxygenase n=1 Tax=Nitrosomonas TaxID=914 RepID=UPI00088C5BF6|nr:MULTISPECIES: FAD-dependent monooxygenase [Nitrosomonas]MXS79995.1 ubiquinone biosynthesis protein UbiH [Nitrosomonas sp. GH22]SCX08542.1 2-octaprenyl-6-methoxyphenol hydroxylase [Nitrosomonas eutropha]SDW00346.1 2-octaprenyl-6-methoxyphenol hydroxylase [Nitrosomonas eutropha]